MTPGQRISRPPYGLTGVPCGVAGRNPQEQLAYVSNGATLTTYGLPQAWPSWTHNEGTPGPGLVLGENNLAYFSYDNDAILTGPNPPLPQLLGNWYLRFEPAVKA
jgi:hypothetical protein